MCFPFYKDLSGIISLTYAIHACTEIINQSCEHLRCTFIKKNFAIFFAIFFRLFKNLLGVDVAL